MRRLFLLCILLACSFGASAASGPDAVRKQVESSMLVTGTIDVDASGKVLGYALDMPEKLPQGIREMADKQIVAWRFEPINIADGQKTRSRMRLFFVAKRIDNRRFEVTLQSAGFDALNDSGRFQVDKSRFRQPVYPFAATKGVSVSGTVYLSLRIGIDGKLRDAAVEQVNLAVIGSEKDMARWREALARNAMASTRTMHFNVPAQAVFEGKEEEIGRVAIEYLLEDTSVPGYGQWRTYVPGPREAIPWANDSLLATSPDTMLPGTYTPAGAGRRLLTPLAGG